MSSSAVDVEVRLKMRDGATAGIKAVSQTAQQEAAKTATATEKAAQKAAEATQKSTARQRSSYEKLSQAREVLGVRSERAIQREIQQTEAAYNRLKASGTLSWQQQAAAADKMRQKVTLLTNEMGKLTAAQKAYAGVKFAAAGVAGVGAAAYTLKGPAERAMSYDRRLANMANTAYAERDAAGREIGMKTLEAAVNKARRQGGGTREQAAEALDTMIASGVVSDADAIKMLPGIMKAATASNTDANALATIAIRAKQSFKISAEDLPGVLSAALAAGQAGGFELKDMAKWLPQQMAMAGNLGLSGKEGFAKLAAWNQGSVITAGSKDEAGNNLRDLLNELNTPHFKKFLGDQLLGDGTPGKKGERYKRMKDIDAVYLDYQSRGIDKVSATVELMQEVFAKDKRYQELQAKLKATDPKDKEGRRAILESMSAQVEGSNIGKVFHNQQSLMAMLGLMNNGQYVGDVLGKVRAEYTAPEDKSATSTAHTVISRTADYKMEQAKEDAAMAQKSAMDGLTPAIGKAAEAFSDLASKHPLLVGTTALATTALGALAGAAGLASVAMGGKGLPGGIGKYAGAASAFGSSAAGKFLGRAAGVGLAWELGHDVIGAGANWGINKLVQMGTGDKDQTLGGWIYDLLHPDSQLAQNLKPNGEAPKMKADVAISVSDDRVSVKSTKLTAFGVDANMNTGNLYTGAPGAGGL